MGPDRGLIRINDTFTVMSRGTDASGRRAQSETLGVVLLLGITIVGATAVVALGSTAISDSKNAVESGSAENAMMQLDSQASLVAHGASDAQTVDLVRDDGQTRVDAGAGRINVTVVNETTGGVEQTIMDVSMGAVVYEQRDTTIAYQGGGVWKRTPGGATMVSPPEFHYRNSTLTLPLVVVEGGPTVSGRTTIEESAATTTKFPSGSDANPIEHGKVNVTVHSAYYRGWGQFFESRTEGSVAYDHPNDNVTLTLTTPVDAVVNGAMSATSASGELEVRGTGGSGGYIDSYNSTTGPYAVATAGNDGNVSYGGDVDLSGNAEVHGNIRSGGDVSVGGSAYVYGKVYYTGTNTSGRTDDGYQRISGVDTTGSVDGLVVGTVSEIKSNPDSSPDIDSGDDELEFSGGQATLDAGQYYLEEIEMNNEDLILDTSGGDISLAIKNYVALENGANISVIGDGVARIFVLGDSKTNSGCYSGFDGCGLTLGKADVHVPGDNSTQLRVYGDQNFNATFEGAGANKARFVGVVFAPAGENGNGGVYLQHSAVYGGIVTGSAIVDNKGQVHYDTALRNKVLSGQGGQVVRITYLHVSYTNVSVGG